MLGALTRGRSETEQKAIVAVAAGTTLALVAMRQRAIRSAIASMLTVRVMKFVCVCEDDAGLCGDAGWSCVREGYWMRLRASSATFYSRRPGGRDWRGRGWDRYRRMRFGGMDYAVGG